MGPDLTDKRWIVAKGILFVLLAVMAGVLQLLSDLPLWQESTLLLVCIWASCRFYYFLFHCLQAYVAPDLKSAGVMDLLEKWWRSRTGRMTPGKIEMMPGNAPILSGSPRRSRLCCWIWMILIVLSGLLWRSRFVSLPPFWTKYGGDALWALVVFFGFASLFPKITTLRLSVIALGFAWLVEFSQLYHAPWIDAIRAARIGHLVLGSTFNWPDLPAYAAGVLIGAFMDGACLQRSGRRR